MKDIQIPLFEDIEDSGIDCDKLFLADKNEIVKADNFHLLKSMLYML